MTEVMGVMVDQELEACHCLEYQYVLVLMKHKQMPRW